MNMTVLNILAFILMILAVIVYYLLYNNFDIEFSFMIYLVLWMFLHEIIHGLSFMFCKEVNSKNVVFGAKLESGIFYCMCKQPISKKVILISLLSPLFFIGIITLILGLVFNWSTIVLLSLFNISGAVGDIVMMIMFLQLPKNIKYTDLDDCEGFVVLCEEVLDNRRFFGLSLIEKGEYRKNIAPHDFKKVTCSKTSLIILIIVLLLFIASLF